jgi:trimethylamine--corrinoid protein Co-methyltransferase
MAIRLDTELLKRKTLQLLAEVGMRVEHEGLAEILVQKGCRRAPSGRLRIPASLIAELVASQEESRSQDEDDQELVPWCGPDWTHWILWSGQKEEVRRRLQSEFLMSAFDCGPTQYYDYPNRKLVAVDTEIFIEMMKFAQATPEIGYISTWYRQDVPPATERISSLILGLQYTTKVDGIESIDPAAIKYLVEIGEILSGRPRDARFLAGSQCLISPLILDHRAAEDMMERARLGVNRFHVASMPTIGMSTPVTVAGAIVIGAAEILGGLAAAFCLCPEGDLTGRMISTVMDMRTADAASAGPENIQAIVGVKKLFDDHFGGHLWTETYFSPSTNRPGLQAVYQNFFAASGFARLTGNPHIPYPGMGTLDNGGVGSPTQFMLDMEIRKSQSALREEIEVTEESLAFEEICARTESGETFLTSDHTLDHYRRLWTSELFPLTVPEVPIAESDEKRILDRCEERWRANVARYEPPDLPPDTLRALQGVLERATRELGS